MKSDALFLAIGEFGRFQVLTILFLTMLGIIGHSDFLTYTLFYNTPEHTCVIPKQYVDNETRSLISAQNSTVDQAFQYKGKDDDELLDTYCNHYITPYLPLTDESEPETVKCSEWEFNKGYPFGKTFVSSFDMLCQYKFRKALGQSLTAIGFLIGAVTFGFLSDRYGRVNTLALAAFLKCICNWMLVAAEGADMLWLFYISYCCVCACSHGLYLVFFVYIIEITGPRMRLFAPALRNLFEVVEEVYCLGLVYVFMDWTHFEMTLGICGLLMLLVLKYCFESPLWLISKGLETQAEYVLLRIAEINKRTVPTEHMRNFIAQALSEEYKSSSVQSNGSSQSASAAQSWTRYLRWIEENITKYREAGTPTAESIYAIDYSRRLELFETACKVFAIPTEVRHVWSRLRYFPWFRATLTSWLYMTTKDHMRKHQKEYRQFQAEIGPEAFKRPLLTHRNAITTGWKRVGKMSRDNTKARESILEEDLAKNVSLSLHNSFCLNRESRVKALPNQAKRLQEQREWMRSYEQLKAWEEIVISSDDEEELLRQFAVSSTSGCSTSKAKSAR